MIKDVIVSLDSHAARDYAISIAGAFQAHLSGIAFTHEPAIPGSIWDDMPATILSRYCQESRDAAAEKRSEFEQKASLAGLNSDSQVIGTTMEDQATTFGRMARCFDLSVVGQAQPEDDDQRQLTIEGALFASGRPVLVVPYIQKSGMRLDRVMVCWDGSRSAARAVADAMPLLQRAGAIEIVTVEQIERRNELVGLEVAQHLARHNVKVELKSIVSKDIDVPSAILSHAADAGADLIVMGGYGHSRIREMVLGGATRGMLEAMTVPTLMSH